MHLHSNVTENEHSNNTEKQIELARTNNGVWMSPILNITSHFAKKKKKRTCARRINVNVNANLREYGSAQIWLLRRQKEKTMWMEEKDVSLPPQVYGSFDRHISHRLTALSIAPGWQVWLTASRWWLNGVVRATVNQQHCHGNKGGNTAARGDLLFYQSHTCIVEHFHFISPKLM